MKKLKLKATIPQEELKRFRQRRPSASLIGAALVLTLVWVFPALVYVHPGWNSVACQWVSKVGPNSSHWSTTARMSSR